jgi:hypothetical protein
MNTRPSGVANRGLTFVFDIRHPNWYVATKIQVFSVLIAQNRDSRGKGPNLNKAEALLARKRCFEGLKPRLKQFEGTAGLKKIIRGTKAQSQIT